jgi:S-adenosylmethionine uptake transporter
MKFFLNINAIKGISWFILSLAIGILNDVVMKYFSSNISVYQVTFLRFFFASVTLLPWLFMNFKSSKTTRLQLHALRGGLLFVGMALWCYGLSNAKLPVATTINFTIPIFTMLLAVKFLKEQINKYRAFAILIGFIGILVVLNPTSSDFHLSSALLVLSSFLFALLDVINKKFVARESMMSMLLYSNIFTALFALPLAVSSWTSIANLKGLLLFILLGAGGNLILYCLLKSFAYIAVSDAMPYRYLELVFSIAAGRFFFHDIMDTSNYLGVALIIAATCLLSYKVAFTKASG